MADESQKLLSFVDIQEGWNDRVDPAKAKGFRVMENVIISDRGGVAIRPGTELFGAANSAGSPCTGIHTAKKRDGTNVMLRSSGTDLEYYNRETAAFATLENTFTTGEIFGFADHNINTDALDYVYGCNAVEPYFRWQLAFDKLTAALGASDTEIVIGSTLLDEVYFTGTASAVTTTTLTIAASSWASDIWNNFYVRITNGAQAGQIRKITATTATQITFDTITGLSGTPTFEIRRAKFPDTGSVIVNTTTIPYTALQKDNALPISAGPTAASGSPVAIKIEFLTGNSCPRGNILRTLFQTMFVTGTKDHPTTIYRSKLQNAADFTYSSPRVAGEGDFLDMPEGGGRIYDLETYEEALVAFKDSYIESISFTQDALDLPIRDPLVKSPLIGTRGRVSRMGDEILFVSPANEITTLSRVKYRDQRPQRTNIAWPIKRGIKQFIFDSTAREYTFRNYTVVSCKRTEASLTNDIMIVYDNNLERWIGVWNLPAAGFTDYDNELYFASAATKEVYKMFPDHTSTKKGDTQNGYDTYCETNWVNKTNDGMSLQSFNLLEITGYIKQNTKINFGLAFDFKAEFAYNWVFDPSVLTADGISSIIEDNDYQAIGINPIGVMPLAMTLGEEVGDYGEQRFYVAYRIPPTLHLWAKLAFSTSGSNLYYDITDIKANFQEEESKYPQYLVKSIEDP